MLWLCPFPLACCPGLPPLHPCPTLTLLWGGKLRPRPHSKSPGPAPALGCPLPQLPAATRRQAGLQQAGPGNSTCPGRLPAGHVCPRPRSLHQARPSTQRLQSLPGAHSSPIPTGGPALGCGAPPPQTWLEIETVTCGGARHLSKVTREPWVGQGFPRCTGLPCQGGGVWQEQGTPRSLSPSWPTWAFRVETTEPPTNFSGQSQPSSITLSSLETTTSRSLSGGN